MLISMDLTPTFHSNCIRSSLSSLSSGMALRGWDIVHVYEKASLFLFSVILFLFLGFSVSSWSSWHSKVLLFKSCHSCNVLLAWIREVRQPDRARKCSKKARVIVGYSHFARLQQISRRVAIKWNVSILKISTFVLCANLYSYSAYFTVSIVV